MHVPTVKRTSGERTRLMRDLLEIMWQRHTCRAAFDPQRAIRETDMQRILDAARWAPTAHNMQNFEIIAVDDKHCLAAISAIQLPPAAYEPVSEDYSTPSNGHRHRITVKRLNSYAEPATKQVCDNFTRIDSDLDGNTATNVTARRCKGADGVWRDV